MKGMQSIKRGAGFRGLLAYVLGSENSSLIGGNIASIEAKSIAKELGMSRALRADIKKPVWHNSLRLPQGESIDSEKWCEIADCYMERMGFSASHPRVYVMHDDPEGQHIHIVASRISINGSIYLGKNENLKSTALIQNLELEYSLTATKGFEAGKKTLRPTATPRPTSGEKGIYDRTGESPARYKLINLIDTAIHGQPNHLEFSERLRASGIYVNFNFSNNSISGCSFLIDGIPFKGSQLGARYSAKSLLMRGLRVEQDQVIEFRRSQRSSTSDCDVRDFSSGDYSFSRASSQRRSPRSDTIDRSPSASRNARVPSGHAPAPARDDHTPRGHNRASRSGDSRIEKSLTSGSGSKEDVGKHNAELDTGAECWTNTSGALPDNDIGDVRFFDVSVNPMPSVVSSTGFNHGSSVARFSVPPLASGRSQQFTLTRILIAIIAAFTGEIGKGLAGGRLLMPSNGPEEGADAKVAIADMEAKPSSERSNPTWTASILPVVASVCLASQARERAPLPPTFHLPQRYKANEANLSRQSRYRCDGPK